MKNILILSPLLLCAISAFAQPAKKSDLATEGLNGKVQQVTQTYYSATQKNGKDTLDIQYESSGMNYVINYNETGYVTAATYFLTGTRQESRNTFTYDGAGNRIEEEWFTDENDLDYKVVSKFSSKGSLMEVKKYHENEELFEKYIYEVDPSSRPVKYTLYDGDDALLGSASFVYDENGDMIEENFFDEKGKRTGKNLYKYDNRHLRTWEENYGPDGVTLMTKRHFQYEYRGKLSMQENYDNNGKLVEKNVYSYNEQANETEWTNFGRNGMVLYKYTYSYEYDAQGNWTKKTVYKDGAAQFITIREIKYY